MPYKDPFHFFLNTVLPVPRCSCCF